jgi:peptidoglycan/LPS O-acetylase OafA/YrhL
VTSSTEAPPIAAPPQTAVFTHNASLDGLRAIAVILVVIEHGTFKLLPKDWWIATGRTGVGVFFVLSGYLITSLLLRENTNRGRVSLKDFYIRRALRIWPLYYAVFLLQAVILIHVSASHWGNIWVSTDQPKYHAFKEVWWSYPIFLQNYFSDLTHYVSLGLGGYWSVAIEEQYYIVWPFALILLARAQWRWSIPTFLISVTVLSLVLRVLTAQHVLPATRSGINVMSHTNLFGLAIGSLLAWYRWDRLRRGGGAPFGTTLAWVVLAALCLRVAAPVVTAGWAIKFPHFELGENLLLSIIVAAIVDAIAAGGSKWSPLQWTPMVYIGRVSYGIYLLHSLILAWVFGLFGGGWPQLVVFMLGSVVAAALSYELFEKRILRLKRRFSHVPSLFTEPPR